MKIIFNVLIIAICFSCEEVYQIEFRNKLSYFNIEAKICDVENESWVSILGNYNPKKIEGIDLEPVNDASIELFENGKSIGFFTADNVEEGRYLPAKTFKACVNCSYFLKIILPDGREIVSAQQVLPKGANIAGITQKLNTVQNAGSFETELFHEIFAKVNTNNNRNLYLLTDWTLYEKINYCHFCQASYNYAAGQCLYDNSVFQPLAVPCQGDCWRIFYNDQIKVYQTEFSQGIIENMPMAKIPYYQVANPFVILKLYSINADSYSYFNTLAQNNAGGNLADTQPGFVKSNFKFVSTKDVVVGNFSVCSVSIEKYNLNRFDANLKNNYPKGLYDYQIFQISLSNVPCIPSKFRTNKKPNA